MEIHENVLHYYKNLLKLKNGEKRSDDCSAKCKVGLFNTIRVMSMARNGRICGEDFSDLDLGTIPLNSIHWSNEGKDPSVFERCRMTISNIQSGNLGEVVYASFSGNGRFLATITDDYYVTIWDVRTGLVKNIIDTKTYTRNRTISLSYNGEYCFICDEYYPIQVYRVSDGQFISKLDYQNEAPRSLTVSDDNKLCYVGTINGTVQIWDISNISSPSIINSIQNFPHKVTNIDIDPESGNILVCVSNISIHVIDPDSDPLKYEYFDIRAITARFIDSNTIMIWRDNGISAVDIKSHKETVLEEYSTNLHTRTSDTNYDVKYNLSLYNEIYDIRTGDVISRLPVFFNKIVFSPDHRYCLTVELSYYDGIPDAPLKLWDIQTGNYLFSFASHNYQSEYCCLSKNENTLLIITNQNNALVFDKMLDRYIGRIETTDSLIRTRTDDNTITELTEGADPNSNPTNNYISRASISDDGKECLLCGNKLILWYPYTNEKYELMNDSVHSPIISKNGSYGLCRYSDNYILFDLQKKKIIKVFPPRDLLISLDHRFFSHDEKQLYIIESNGTINIYETSTGILISNNNRILSNDDKGKTSSADISPDSTKLIAFIRHSSDLPNKNKVVCYDLQKNEIIGCFSPCDNCSTTTVFRERFCDISCSRKIITVHFLHDSRHFLLKYHDTDIIEIYEFETMKIISTIKDTSYGMSERCSLVLFQNSYIISDTSGKIQVEKIEKSSNGEYNLKKIMNICHIDSLHIDNCSFKDCIADDSIKTTLRQYGALL